MKAGAFDYFRKPFDTDELLAVVRRALETVRLAHENERLAGELALARTMVFASEAMRRLAVLVARVAPRDVTVLLTGESGTGKERVAEAIVLASARADRPFVRFNCAALPAELAEAELFGHAKGAFTGAARARPGLFREADGGTLLLDEVGELAPPAQAKLLRVLQEGEVRPVGEERARIVDVRVVAATHRDLAEEVRAGRFREDLLYRLDVVKLRIPPLRERPEDVPVLARHFLDRFSRRFGVAPLRVPDALFDRLAAHAWPGNVRELENAIEGLVALSPAEGLDLSLLPGAGATAAEGPPLPLKERVQAYERGLVVEALRAARGNRTEAARRLGVSRVTLHDKLRRYGLAGAEGEESDEGPAER
jgi:DNA-binding NtrC family response regulator